MREIVKTSYWKKCRGYGRAIVVLLLFLLSSTGAGTNSLPRWQQADAAMVPCVLKSDLSECTVKPGEIVTSLSLGQVFNEEIAGGQRRLYRVHLIEGQFLQVNVEQLGIDLIITACNPSEQRTARVDRQSGSWGPENLSLLAATSGEYRVQVRPVGAVAASGHYQIKIKELRESKNPDEVRVAAERVVTEGGDYYSKGKPNCLREAIRTYDEALRLWQSLGDNYEIAMTLYGLGWSYSDLGTYGTVKFPTPQYRLRWSYESREAHLRALDFFDRSLTIMQAANNQHGQAMDLAGRAWPNLYLGRNEEALDDFSKARSIFQTLGNLRGEALASYGLGWAYALLNDNERALDNFLHSFSLREKVGDQKGGANTLAAICRIYSRLGRNQEALDFGSRALTLYEKAKDDHGRASTKAILGWVYSDLSRWADAEAAFEASLSLRDINDPTGRANALYGLARVKNEQGNLPGALAKMQEVLDIIEPLRIRGSSSELRTYYFANVQEYYEFEIDLLMRMHQLQPTAGFAERALSATERARARELLAILAESNESRDNQLNSGLANPLDSANIRALLDDDTLLLEYSLGKQRSYLWLVSKAEISSYQLPKREEIEGKAARLYEVMTERRGSRFGASWKEDAARKNLEAEGLQQELGQLLLGQVAQKLGSKRLVFVTQGTLQLVPFGGLLASSAPNSPAEPLVLNHEILMVPSASVLKVLRQNALRVSHATKTVAVLADPVFTQDDPRVPLALSRAKISLIGGHGATSGDSRPNSIPAVQDSVENNYRRLPGTRWEADQIISLVPKHEGLLAVDFTANRETAMSDALRSYRIIHFATHAFVNDSNPTLSRIVLSQFDEKGEPRNGDLTIADLYKLNLEADLVVLSACRTGGGTDTRGEGLIGLTGGFMHAGVPRVLVSLWPISDTVTAQFMSRFYRKMLGKEKLTPSQALRQVQIEMLKDPRWRVPYFWAPFILTGDWK